MSKFLLRSRRILLLPEMKESLNYKSKRVNHATSTSWKEKTPALLTNTYGEKPTPLSLARAIAIAMGLHFIVMVMIYSAIVINSLFNQAAPISLNESYCGPCPKNWICYRNNCYQFFNESKSWFQSHASCISRNSHLLKIYDQEDQNFLTLVKSYHWMGLAQNPTNGSWLWEDGSILSPDQLTLVEMESGTCALYGSNFRGYTENCSTPSTYICMKSVV